MAEFILTDKQLQTIEGVLSSQKNYDLAKENWERFSQEEKEWLVECLKSLHPEKAKLVTEAWYNTLGDIVGIFDPTGVVDLVNGISYIAQGENLFGFLSLISAVPYVGDLVAKPVMGALKVGAPAAKSLNNVLKLSRAGKSAEAAKELARVSSYGGLTSKFVRGFGQVASKLRGYIERMPIGMFKGVKNTILQWFDLFEKAAKGGTTVRRAGQRLANRFTKLSPQLQAKNLENLIQLSKSTPGMFTGYRTTKGILSWKSLFRGMPQLMGRNASVRALARQTKWWAGFLDYIGVGNWVGPDEVKAKLGDAKFISKLEGYQNTQEGRQNFEQDFGSETSQPMSTSEPTQTTSTSSTTSTEKDPFANMLNKLFMGAVNPLP